MKRPAIGFDARFLGVTITTRQGGSGKSIGSSRKFLELKRRTNAGSVASNTMSDLYQQQTGRHQWGAANETGMILPMSPAVIYTIADFVDPGSRTDLIIASVWAAALRSQRSLHCPS
jgi:hypothetical protein